MNSLLKRIYTTGKVEDKDGKPVKWFPVSVSYQTGMLLYDLIRKYQLKRTLETGMAYGLSSLFICQALRDNGSGLHTAIDPSQHENWRSIGLLNIERAGLNDQFRFFHEKSHDILPRLHSGQEQFDFAFVDGMHLFDYALVDFFYIDQLLSVGGYVVFDDIWMPGIRKIISFVLRNRSYERVKPPPGRGTTWLLYLILTAQRFFQNPFGKDLAIKLIPGNVCVLRKLADDSRAWNHHRSF